MAFGLMSAWFAEVCVVKWSFYSFPSILMQCNKHVSFQIRMNFYELCFVELVWIIQTRIPNFFTLFFLGKNLIIFPLNSVVSRCKMFWNSSVAFFRYFVISSFLSCHYSAYCLCLFWFLLFPSFKVSSFHFYFYFSGILCLFPLLSLIR